MTSFQHKPLLTQAVDHLNAGRIHQAEATCRRLLMEKKTSHQAIAILGKIAAMQNKYDDAIEHFTRSISLRPRETHYHLLLAETLTDCGRHDEALSRYDRVLRLRREYQPAMAGKANALIRTGRWKEARALLEPLVSRGSEDAVVAIVFARIATHDGEHDRAVQVASRHLDDQVPDETRRTLHFDIGRALERAGDYDRAFAAYTRGNETARGEWDPVAESDRYDRVMAFFSRERLRNLPHPSPPVRRRSRTAVFLVGMPRTGSTLTEQIIDAHPDACGAGELLALPEMVDDLGLRIGSTLPYPDCVADLETGDIDTLADRYLETLRRPAPDAARICDKYLGNYEHIGLIATLFPDAAIIHTRRDPLDTCLSCYVQRFSAAMPAFTTDLRHLGAQYNDYLAVMEHWRRVLPGRIFELDYEDLVNNQEAVSRRLIEHVGLPWDDRCLRFYETGREVITLSRDQVNKPIYSTAINRHRHYEAHLAPLKDILDRGLRGRDLG